MAYRSGSHVLAAFALAASLAWATGCNSDDDDSCIQCCKCSNDGSTMVYRPGSTDECTSCEEQCQALADREFLGQEFDNVERIECPD